MRNLKKVLSLVLALAMVLSICMVGASAVNYDDFGDKDEITKKEAVETLVNLNVLDGYNGGAEFRPADNVKRSEMAAMICRILAGGDNMIVDATKPVPTYADIDGHWAESYIEYCTSLGIVSGKGNGIFDPEAFVTAAEAAKMVMTALGYNADIEQFKGIGWDINTMAKANTLKLLENLQGEISASVPATREQVAQLVYNALTIPMVQNYVGNSANLWIGSGANAYQQTLLEKAFEAKKVTGVVIANEWASLYDNKPLNEGKTQLMLLDNEGKIAYNGDWSKYISTKEFQEDLLTVNASTTLEQVGSSVTVMYRSGTRQEVFGVVMDSGLNKTVEFTKGGKIETPDLKFGEKQDTMYFVNYGDRSYSNGYTADLKFTYTYFVDADGEKLLTQDEVRDAKGVTLKSKPVRVGDEITSSELYVIRSAYNELTHGSDTLSLTYGNASTPVNDEYTWSRFVSTFLSDNGVVFDVKEPIDRIENGNYAKLVDCDGDGIAEFYFEIDYWMDEVATAREKDGKYTYTFYSDKSVLNDGKDGNVTRIETSDDLAKGDIVVYTIIDGIAYVDIADDVTGKVKTVSYRNESITTTDGDEYFQSGITNVTGYSEKITDASDDLEYKFYFDKYGYIRIYKEVEGQTAYGLLTEAYLTNENNSKYVKNYVPHVELTAGAEKTREYVVSNWSEKGSNDFFDGVLIEKGANLVEAASHLGLVRRADVVSFDDTKTNVAKFVLDEENNEVKLTTAAKYAYTRDGQQWYYEAKGSNDKITEKDWKKAHPKDTWETSYPYSHPVYAIDYVELDPSQDITKGDRTYEAAKGALDNEYVNGVHDTEYYLVSNDRVTYITDYANLPAVKADDITAIYAVAENTTADSNKQDYWVAKVVVIELKKWEIDYDSIALAYYNPFKNTKEIKYLETLNSKETDPKVTLLPKKGVGVEEWNGQWELDGFYRVYNTGKSEDGMTAESIERIDSKYNTYGIYAGTVTREASIIDRGEYIMVSRDNNDPDDKPAVESLDVKNVPVYSINDKDAVLRSTDDLKEADGLNAASQIIWVKDGNRTAFVVIVNYSGRDWTNASWLLTEWTRIMTEQNTPDSASVKFFGVADEVYDRAPDATDKDRDGDEREITVTYATAKAFVEANPNADIIEIESSSATIITNSVGDPVKVEDAALVPDGTTWRVYIGTTVYTLVQEGADDNVDLRTPDNKLVDKDSGAIYDGPEHNFSAIPTLNWHTDSPLAKITKWEFFKKGSTTPLTEAEVSTHTIEDEDYAKVTVTAESGDTQTYTITFQVAARDDALSEAIQVLKETDFEVFYNGYKFYDTSAKAYSDLKPFTTDNNTGEMNAEAVIAETIKTALNAQGETWAVSVEFSASQDGGVITKDSLKSLWGKDGSKLLPKYDVTLIRNGVTYGPAGSVDAGNSGAYASDLSGVEIGVVQCFADVKHLADTITTAYAVGNVATNTIYRHVVAGAGGGVYFTSTDASTEAANGNAAPWMTADPTYVLNALVKSKITAELTANMEGSWWTAKVGATDRGMFECNEDNAKQLWAAHAYPGTTTATTSWANANIDGQEVGVLVGTDTTTWTGAVFQTIIEFFYKNADGNWITTGIQAPIYFKVAASTH